MNRIYIFTGKGGVGKTSIAAAHAVKSAEEGYRTLLVSTDMAHNLGDLFDVHLDKEPVSITENLDVYEIDPNHVMENDFRDLADCIGKLLAFGSEDFMADYGMLPGMEELFALLKIDELYNQGIYGRIIVDCAPTGETLSLLKFPELLSWYMEKLFPIGKVAVRVLAPVSRQIFKIEMPNQAAMTDIEKMYVKMTKLQELLKNREVTSIRLVTIPEKMVVEETKRNYMYMNLYNFNVDALYINRIIPGDINNSFFDEWLRIQGKYIGQLKESFAALPLYYIPWYEEEVQGMRAVQRICEDVLKHEEIFEIKILTQKEAFKQNAKGYMLTVAIPYADKKDMELYQSETDVVIKINNFKRNIPLPNILRTYVITSAELQEGVLNIQFEEGKKYEP